MITLARFVRASAWVPEEAMRPSAILNTDLTEVMALAAAGKIQHTIKTIGFKQINEFLELMRGNDIVGRAVVKF